MGKRVRIEADLKQFFRALDVLEGPGPETLQALDAALMGAFVQTQMATHIITGSLKGSGRKSSEPSRQGWSGEISYGGPSPGFPNDPVDYAIYEMRRGQAHDFFSSLPLIYGDFELAMFATVKARL